MNARVRKVPHFLREQVMQHLQSRKTRENGALPPGAGDDWKSGIMRQRYGQEQR